MVDDLNKKVWEEMLPEIRGGIKVRPELKTEDLRLIRRGFVALIRSGKARGLFEVGVSDELRCSELLKRMLRKVKYL